MGPDQLAQLVRLNRLNNSNHGRRSYQHHNRNSNSTKLNGNHSVGQQQQKKDNLIDTMNSDYFKDVASLIEKVSSQTDKNAQQNDSLLIFNQLNLSQLVNSNNRGGLNNLALAAALANAQQQLNNNSDTTASKNDTSLSLLNESNANKMFNLLGNNEEINEKMLQLNINNYLEALKNGALKQDEEDMDIIVDKDSETKSNEDYEDDETTIAEEDEEHDEELNDQMETKNHDDEEEIDKHQNGDLTDVENDQGSSTENGLENAEEDEKSDNNKLKTKKPNSHDEDESISEEHKENGLKKKSSDNEDFEHKRRTRSRSLDHQNGKSKLLDTNESDSKTDESEDGYKQSNDTRKKTRRNKSHLNGINLGNLVAKLSKKAEQQRKDEQLVEDSRE